MDSQLLTTAEVAQRLGCHRATVQRLVAAGALTPAHQGPGLRGAHFFAAADIDAYIAQRAEGAA